MTILVKKWNKFVLRKLTLDFILTFIGINFISKEKTSNSTIYLTSKIVNEENYDTLINKCKEYIIKQYE